MRVDSGWNGWDMEIYGSRYVKIRITTATEHHHGVGKLTRVRVEPLMSNFCRVLLVGELHPGRPAAAAGLPLAVQPHGGADPADVVDDVPRQPLAGDDAGAGHDRRGGREESGYWPVPAKEPPMAAAGVEPLPQPVAVHGLRDDEAEHALA